VTCILRGRMSRQGALRAVALIALALALPAAPAAGQAGVAYSVPADNPFVGTAGARPEIWSYGLRNPWRFSFDAATGDMYVADVGQDRWEEINFVPASPRVMTNFGWPVYEGRDRISDAAPGAAGVLVSPVHVYSREDGCSVIGGYVYRGSQLRALRGRYFYGDYCSGTVWSLRIRDAAAIDVRRESVRVPGLTSFGADVEGELYLASQDGSIYRLEAE
jgi:glucose/arabinose dehydrogenase